MSSVNSILQYVASSSISILTVDNSQLTQIYHKKTARVPFTVIKESEEHLKPKFSMFCVQFQKKTFFEK